MARIIVTSSDGSLPYANGQREALAQEFAHKRYENEINRNKPDFERYQKAIALADSIANSKGIGAIANGIGSAGSAIYGAGQELGDQIDLNRLNNPQAAEALSQAAQSRDTTIGSDGGAVSAQGASPSPSGSIGRDLSKETMGMDGGNFPQRNPANKPRQQYLDDLGDKYQANMGPNEQFYQDQRDSLYYDLKEAKDPKEVARITAELNQLEDAHKETINQLGSSPDKTRQDFQDYQRRAGLDMHGTRQLRYAPTENSTDAGRILDKNSQDALARAAMAHKGQASDFASTQNRILGKGGQQDQWLNARQNQAPYQQTPEAADQLGILQFEQARANAGREPLAQIGKGKKAVVLSKLQNAIHNLREDDPKHDQKLHVLNMALHKLETPMSPQEAEHYRQNDQQMNALEGTQQQTPLVQSQPLQQMPTQRPTGGGATLPNPMKASDPNSMASFGPDGHGNYIAPPAGAQISEGEFPLGSGPHGDKVNYHSPYETKPAAQTAMPQTAGAKSADGRFQQNAQGKWEMAPKAQKMSPGEIILAARMAHTPEQQKAVMQAAKDADVPFTTLGELLTGSHKLKFAEAVAKHIPKEGRHLTQEELDLKKAQAAQLWAKANGYAKELENKGKSAEANAVRAAAYRDAVALDKEFKPREIVVKEQNARSAASQAHTGARAESAKEKAGYYEKTPEEPADEKQSRKVVEKADAAKTKLEGEANAPLGAEPDVDDDPKGHAIWQTAKYKKGIAKKALDAINKSEQPGGEIHKHRQKVNKANTRLEGKRTPDYSSELKGSVFDPAVGGKANPNRKPRKVQ